MGRRIPKSRRHKKLKFVDPCYSDHRVNLRNRKLDKNEPPKHDDYQEVPNNMRELIDIKNKVKQNKLKRRRKKKNALKDDFIVVRREKIENGLHGMTRPLKSIPEKLVQKPNESVKQFLTKLQNMASSAIAEAEVEQKYDIDLFHVDDKTVAVVPSKKDPEEMDENMNKESFKQTGKRKKKPKGKNNVKVETLTDTVKFGEVVLEPPTLSAKPRKSVGTEKPGQRNLHLKKMLENNFQQPAVKNKLSGFKLKRRDLPVGQRKVLENERVRVVDLYRSLKQRKKPCL